MPNVDPEIRDGLLLVQITDASKCHVPTAGPCASGEMAVLGAMLSARDLRSPSTTFYHFVENGLCCPSEVVINDGSIH
jgi:hypothetical protein